MKSSFGNAITFCDLLRDVLIWPIKIIGFRLVVAKYRIAIALIKLRNM